MSKNICDYQFPQDLKAMSVSEMEHLAGDIRDFIIDNLSKTGGHLASNLGVVELTLALHKTFESPKDKLIWDVGHQSYVHKILTGRACGFETLRQMDGLSGFPKSSESPHDIFDTGHEQVTTTQLYAAHKMNVKRELVNDMEWELERKDMGEDNKKD